MLPSPAVDQSLNLIPAVPHDPVTTWGLTMKGSIRTTDKCPVCKQSFQQIRHPLVRKQVIDIMCPTCMTRPRPGTFFIDGRWLKDREGAIGRLSCDRDKKPFASFLHAHRTLETILKEIDEGRFKSSRWRPEALGKFAISHACDPWIEHLRRDASKEYADHQLRFIHKWILPALGDLDVRDIRGLDIEQLPAKLQTMRTRKGTPPSGNTIRNILTALRTLLGWLVEKDVIDKAPSFPPLSPIPRENVGWISREKQQKVIAILREDMRLMAEAMMETAMRPNEAVALKVKDLREDRCSVYVERALTRRKKVKGTKTGVSALRPVSPELFARLKEAAKDKLPEAWLFVNKVGTPFLTSQFSWEWRKAADQAGIKACLYVSSRHSEVSRLRGELEDEMLVQLRKKLAHSPGSTVTLKNYVRDEKEEAQ